MHRFMQSKIDAVLRSQRVEEEEKKQNMASMIPQPAQMMLNPMQPQTNPKHKHVDSIGMMSSSLPRRELDPQNTHK